MNTGQNNLGPGDTGFPDCTPAEHQDFTTRQIQALRKPRVAANLPDFDVTDGAQALITTATSQAGHTSTTWSNNWDGLMCGDDFAPGPLDQWADNTGNNAAPFSLTR